MFNSCDTDFNLDRHFIPFLQDVAFFAELSRHLKKIPTKAMPTCAVTYDPKADEMCLFWNPDFFGSLTDWEIRGVLTHEFYHLVFGHLHSRRKTPPKMWNVAADLAINSIILENVVRPQNQSASGNAGSSPLPDCALIPGQWPKMPGGREMSADEKQGAKLAELIAGFPKMKSSEWYFAKLAEEAAKSEGGGDGEGNEWFDSFDDHTPWDQVPEDLRE
jgi:hypothetical protein